MPVMTIFKTHLRTKVRKMFSFLSKKIAIKLFMIYLLAITIPVSLFGILSFQLTSSAVKSDYIQFKESLNRQVSANIDEDLSNLKEQSASIIMNINDISNFLNYPPKIIDNAYFETKNRLNTYFLSILQNNERLDGIGLIQLSGDVVYYMNRDQSSTNLISVKEDPWFSDTIDANGDPILLGPHSNKFLFNYNSSPGNKDEIITYSRLIKDFYNFNEVKGVLIFDQNVQQFADLVADTNSLADETLIILDNEDKLIYSNDLNLNHETISETIHHFNTQRQGSYETEVGDEKMFVSIDISSQFGWKVISLIPLEFLSQKTAFIQKINFSLLLVLIFIIFIISILISNIINHPLKKLVASFKKLQKGDFNATVPVKGEDELAQIGLTFNIMVNNMNNLITQKYELIILKKHAELESLQSQINPHFLYNTLSSAKAVIDKGDYNKASEFIQNLSDIFRYSLNRGIYIVNFVDELEHVKKYLYIQETRFAGKYNVCYDIDKEVLGLPIPRLTLQPIVENAIYHGFEGRSADCEIKIAAKLFDDRYFVYVTDNGVGIPEHELQKMNVFLESDEENNHMNNPEKVGMYNVNSRIKLHFGNTCGIKVFSTEGSGTVVRITLPATIIRGGNPIENTGR